MTKIRQICSWLIFPAVGMFCLSQATSAASDHTSDIRSIDFRNFTYPISGTVAEDILKAKSIRVRNGIYEKEWRDKVGDMQQSVNFSVNNVSYSDINRDGKEEAVVDTGFSWTGASEQTAALMHIYMLKGGKPVRLLVPDLEAQLGRDFSPANEQDPCEDGIYTWTSQATGEGVVKVDAFVGNLKICYDEKKGYNMLTMKYWLKDNRWILAEAPKRWRKKQ
jgi:hypothetical protein